MRINRLRSAEKPVQDFCQASCQKTCPNGPDESDCCHYASASSSIMSTILLSTTSPPSARMWRYSGLETFVFSPGKFCELRDFAYGQNLCVLYAKFPPPKAKRLQLVYAPLIPTGEEWSPSLPQCGVDRQHSVAREIPASLAFKAAPRKCKQASIPLGLHLN